MNRYAIVLIIFQFQVGLKPDGFFVLKENIARSGTFLLSHSLIWLLWSGRVVSNVLSIRHFNEVLLFDLFICNQNAWNILEIWDGGVNSWKCCCMHLYPLNFKLHCYKEPKTVRIIINWFLQGTRVSIQGPTSPRFC